MQNFFEKLPIHITLYITLYLCLPTLCTQTKDTALTNYKGLTMRTTTYKCNPLFVNRISARQMTGETIDRYTMNTLIQAAHWAPSSYNEQPWFFAYAMRGTQAWKTLLDCLVPANKTWAQDSAVLGIMFAKKKYTRNNKPNPSALFDVGAAFENMALQGSLLGLTVIALGGLDWGKLYTIASSIGQKEDTTWNIQTTPQISDFMEKYTIAGMFVIGKPQAKQNKISQRKPLTTASIELVGIIRKN